MSWYYANGSERIGPLADADWQAAIASGAVQPDTLVWRDGMTDWLPYRQVSGAARPPGMPPPPGVAGGVVCVECGRSLPPSEVVQIEGRFVCGPCKPLLVQKLKEGIALPGMLQYAGFWIRFGAMVIDYIILNVLNFLLVIPFHILGALGAQPGQPPGAVQWLGFALILLLQIGIGIAYNVFFVGKYSATPGKMACGLVILRPDGSRLTYGRATGRYFAEWVSGLTLGIGYIMAAFDEEKQALHDRIADTRVVYK